MAVAQYRLQKGAPAQAEDLAQATLELVLEKIQTVDSNPHMYALEILRNKIGDHLRTHARRTEHQLSPTGTTDPDSRGEDANLVVEDPEGTEFERQLENTDRLENIRQAIHKLRPFCQMLFLAMLEGRTVSELWESATARNPKLSRSTFDKRVFDCRKKLRIYLREDIKGNI